MRVGDGERWYACVYVSADVDSARVEEERTRDLELVDDDVGTDAAGRGAAAEGSSGCCGFLLKRLPKERKVWARFMKEGRGGMGAGADGAGGVGGVGGGGGRGRMVERVERAGNAGAEAVGAGRTGVESGRLRPDGGLLTACAPLGSEGAWLRMAPHELCENGCG